MAKATGYEQICIDLIEPALGGRWVMGRVQDHSFCAKVYPEHALFPSFELGASRISKLELRQISDDRIVATFDRGWDKLPRTKAAEKVVDLLMASLADRIFADCIHHSPPSHAVAQSYEQPAPTETQVPSRPLSTASNDAHTGHATNEYGGSGHDQQRRVHRRLTTKSILNL